MQRKTIFRVSGTVLGVLLLLAAWQALFGTSRRAPSPSWERSKTRGFSEREFVPEEVGADGEGDWDEDQGQEQGLGRHEVDFDRLRAAAALENLRRAALLRAALAAQMAAQAQASGAWGGVNGGWQAQQSPGDNWSGSNDRFWSSRFSAGNSNPDNTQGYVSVPGVGPVGYGF